MTFTKEVEGIRAPKLSLRGAVYYSVWSDDHGETFIRIDANEVHEVIKNGTYSKKGVFRLSEIGLGPPISGFDPNTGKSLVSKDKNMRGFLQAAKNHFDLSASSVASSEKTA